MSPAPTATAQRRDVLPQPSGKHSVGRCSMELVDSGRRDIYSAEPGDRRELVLWTWYPAAPDTIGQRADFLPTPWTPIADFLGIDVAGVHTHATTDAPLADEHDVYPVLILSPSGFSPLLLAATAEELASHGYVVVGVNHTYETAVTAFADGRIVTMNPAALGGALGPQTGPHDEAFRRRAAVCDYKAADLRSVADHLGRLAPNPAGLTTNRLDLARLGAFGHSFGGNAALEWCRTDERCLAAANLDGAIWTTVGTVGLPRPALQLLADHPEFAMSGKDAVKTGITTDASWYDAEKTLTYDGWRTVHRLARPGHTARIGGATHMSFMDIPFLPLRQDSPVSDMLAATSIEPQRMWRITSDLLLAFFSRYLQGADTPLLDSPDADHPEVAIGPP